MPKNRIARPGKTKVNTHNLVIGNHKQKKIVSEGNGDKSLESWIWDAACAIRGDQDAPKFKDFILPLIFVKRLCDVFDDEVAGIAKKVGTREKALKLIEKDKKIVRFYLPLKPANIETDDSWSVIRKLSDKIGEWLTTIMRDIANHNPRIKGIIDRVDFNATTHGQRDISDEGLSRLIEKVSLKKLGLKDVEADIIGRSYEYLIRKFAEGGGSSAGEFYTPKEVGMIMARILDPEPGMEIYDPCCGSAGLLIKCELALEEKMKKKGAKYSPLNLCGQESIPNTWAMANMNMVIHDMQGELEIGDTMRTPKFKKGNRLKQFDLVVANPMWNQDGFTARDYENDEFDRFKAGFPNQSSADWSWAQHILASLKDEGRAAIVLDTGAASRGSGNASDNKEKKIRQWFVDRDLIEGVLYLPENLFYNTPAPGIILFLNKNKSAKRKGKIMLVNASLAFEKGAPKNFVPDQHQKAIVDAVSKWSEIVKFSKIVPIADIAKNDFNISPTRFIDVGVSVVHRSMRELIDELSSLDEEESKVNTELKKILANVK